MAELRGAGHEVDAEVLAHISPVRSQAANCYGSITVGYDREIAQLDEHGHCTPPSAPLIPHEKPRNQSDAGRVSYFMRNHGETIGIGVPSADPPGPPEAKRERSA